MKEILKKIEAKIEDTLEKSVKNGMKYYVAGMAAGIIGYVSCGSGIVSENPYIRGNLGDSLLSGAYYCALRSWGISKAYSGIATFCMASLGELSQFTGLAKGTFDPLDFLAYGLGIILAIGIDSVIQVKNKPKNKGLESLV
jgi:hypothetical protein